MMNPSFDEVHSGSVRKCQAAQANYRLVNGLLWKLEFGELVEDPIPNKMHTGPAGTMGLGGCLVPWLSGVECAVKAVIPFNCTVVTIFLSNFFLLVKFRLRQRIDVTNTSRIAQPRFWRTALAI